ncbi:hypothetical protein QQF64_014647 [Cirrhinus molitorella]|uniref:Uncharacterized protein n=1 Tax=Cirrhinus molitorella TaxID=172907 RepID=A0ABR3NTF5_9TELE
MKKSLAAALPRLKRMIIRLQKYDITIIHQPGKEIPVADTLSRKPIETERDNLSEGMDMQVHIVYRSLPVSDAKLQQIRAETESDSQLVQLSFTLDNPFAYRNKASGSLLLLFILPTQKDHVCTSDGWMYHRNRRHLFSTKEEPVEPCVSTNIEEEQNNNASPMLQVHAEVPAQPVKDREIWPYNTIPDLVEQCDQEKSLICDL